MLYAWVYKMTNKLLQTYFVEWVKRFPFHSPEKIENEHKIYV